MNTVFWIGIGISVVALTISLLARLALSWVLRKRNVPEAETYPRVTILKPVKEFTRTSMVI